MIQLRAARPNDSAAIARIHADTWQAAYASLLPPEIVAAEDYDTRAAFWKKRLIHNPQGVFLAEDDALGPMGFVSCGPAVEPIKMDSGNFRGEVYALYVRPVCQGMGLGQQLLQAAIGNLQKAGYSAVMIWIPAQSSACKFFVRMGGQIIGDRRTEVGGKDLHETAYGWGGRLK